MRRLLTSGGELALGMGDRIRQLVAGGFDVTVGSGVVRNSAKTGWPRRY